MGTTEIHIENNSVQDVGDGSKIYPSTCKKTQGARLTRDSKTVAIQKAFTGTEKTSKGAFI